MSHGETKESSSRPATVADCAVMLGAIERFLSENAGFESSAVLKLALTDIAAAATLSAAFEIPLKHRLLGFSAAQLWMLFMSQAAAEVTKRDGKKFTPLKLKSAMKQLVAVYDRAMERDVFVHFDPEEESEDEGDESSSSGEDYEDDKPRGREREKSSAD
jgi:hypothetical protein